MSFQRVRSFDYLNHFHLQVRHVRMELNNSYIYRYYSTPLWFLHMHLEWLHMSQSCISAWGQNESRAFFFVDIMAASTIPWIPDFSGSGVQRRHVLCHFPVAVPVKHFWSEVNAVQCHLFGRRRRGSNGVTLHAGLLATCELTYPFWFPLIGETELHNVQ